MSACRRRRTGFAIITIAPTFTDGPKASLARFGDEVNNGAMTEEPASLIFELLRKMRAELGDVRAEIGQLRSDIGQVRADFATKSDLNTLRADVAADILSTRKELSEQIVGLRRSVIEWSNIIPQSSAMASSSASSRRACAASSST